MNDTEGKYKNLIKALESTVELFDKFVADNKKRTGHHDKYVSGNSDAYKVASAHVARTIEYYK